MKRGDAKLPRPPSGLSGDVLRLYTDILQGVVDSVRAHGRGWTPDRPRCLWQGGTHPALACVGTWHALASGHLGRAASTLTVLVRCPAVLLHRPQYHVDLEKALREGRPPPPPPEGVSQDTLNLYHQIMAHLKRVEVRGDPATLIG